MSVILLIEDDNELREMLKSALLRKDFIVLGADVTFYKPFSINDLIGKICELLQIEQSV